MDNSASLGAYDQESPDDPISIHLSRLGLFIHKRKRMLIFASILVFILTSILSGSLLPTKGELAQVMGCVASVIICIVWCIFGAVSKLDFDEQYRYKSIDMMTYS